MFGLVEHEKSFVTPGPACKVQSIEHIQYGNYLEANVPNVIVCMHYADVSRRLFKILSLS